MPRQKENINKFLTIFYAPLDFSDDFVYNKGNQGSRVAPRSFENNRDATG